MANSYVFYPNATGSTTDYPIPFEYLSQTFVKATVNGASVPFTFLSTYMIRFSVAPVGALKIYRQTSKAPVNSYINGSILVDTQLNGSFLQSLHVSEEVADSSMQTASDGPWDGQNLRIKNVANPVNDQDVVTKKWATDTGNAYVGAAGASAAAAAASAASALADKNTVAADKATVAADKATVATDKGIVLGYRNEVEADRAEVATNKEAVAADKATVAADKATVAADKATTSGYKDAANTSATNAATSASGASTSATNAATSATNASNSATLANKWAQELEDVPVTTGKFSAFHWAQKALAAAGTALGNFAAAIHGATSKTPVGADEIAVADSAASWVLKKITLDSIKTFITSSAMSITGTLTTTGNIQSGPQGTQGSVVLQGGQSIEVGAGRTADGIAFIDLSAVTGADYNSRVVRNTGANGTLQILNTGTGDIQLSGGGNLTWNGGQILPVGSNDARYAAYRVTTISTAAPSGGANGDLWFQV